MPKLLPPEPPDGFVRRRDLVARLDGAFECRLTTVVAGAGYGKSTLLASWARAPACSWFTCDPADRRLPYFVSGLAESVRAASPALANELAFAAEGADDVARVEPLAALICRALHERLENDTVLVIDDVHALGRTSASARLLSALVRHAPLRFHLILSSREQPPFSVERLRGRGGVLDLRASDLAFTRSEVAELIAAVLGERDDAASEGLHGLTRGWPAAVRVALEGVRLADDPGDALASLSPGRTPLFGYLVDEALAAQPVSLGEFLRLVAPLERLTADLCRSVGVDDPESRLQAAADLGLVVPLSSDDEQWFTVHELVRQAVEAKWPLDRTTFVRILRCSAAWLEKRGLVAPALHELARIRDGEAIARLLGAHGDELLSAGAVSGVVAAAAFVPEALRTVAFDELLGHAHYVLGDWESAAAYLERAARAHDVLPAGLAWRLSAVQHFLGGFEEIVRICARARMDGSHPADEASVLATSAYAHWLMGDVRTAEELSVRALETSAATGEAGALVTAHNAAGNIATSQGRHHDAIRHFSRAAGAAERVHDVLLLARVHENWANPLHALGRFDEALEQEARAIGLAEVAGFAFLHALALRDRAATNLGLGRLDEAVADAEAATAIYRSIDSGWVCVSLAALGDVYRERGEIELARAAYEESLGAESSGEAPILIIVRSGLARVLALEEPQRAADLARRATVQGPAPGTVEGLLAAGWIALAHGDHAAAGLRAQEASAAARHRDERPGLAEALELRALSAAEPSHELASLHEAAALWRKLGNPVAEARTEYALARIVDARHDAERAKRKLGRLGVRVESAGQAAGLLMALGAEPDAPLRIQTLGAFRILRDGQPAPMSEWQSKKARRLLKTLVARRGRPVPRDVLMDALWPDDDSAAVAKRLSVAVSTIRAVLDPTGRYEPDHFVGGSDALALDYAHVDVDVEDFLSDAARGVEALREGRHGEALELLEAAEAAYSGEFLEEELYEDWAAPLREEARAAYISVARALAIESAKARDHDATVRYRLRLLQRDPYDEDAHLGVVSALIESRRHGDARRAYGVYVTRMEEISLEPAPYPIVDRP